MQGPERRIKQRLVADLPRACAMTTAMDRSTGRPSIFMATFWVRGNKALHPYWRWAVIWHIAHRRFCRKLFARLEKKFF